MAQVEGSLSLQLLAESCTPIQASLGSPDGCREPLHNHGLPKYSNSANSADPCTDPAHQEDFHVLRPHGVAQPFEGVRASLPVGPDHGQRRWISPIFERQENRRSPWLNADVSQLRVYPTTTERSGDNLIANDGRSIPIEDAVNLPPTAPSKIICVHLNYRSRVEEFMTKLPAAPTYFHEPVSVLNAHKCGIVRPERCNC